MVPLEPRRDREKQLSLMRQHSLLMKHRREHIECESMPGLGCLVYGTKICTHRRKPIQKLKRWLKTRLTVELWWVLMAMVPGGGGGGGGGGRAGGGGGPRRAC